MRRIGLGAMGIVWGGAIVLAAAMREPSFDSGAFGLGQFIGLLLGIAMLVAGARILFKPSRTTTGATNGWRGSR